MRHSLRFFKEKIKNSSYVWVLYTPNGKVVKLWSANKFKDAVRRWMKV